MTPESDSPLEAAQQVVVVGAPRSGTSAVLGGIREVLGYRGHHEGHVMTLLSALHDTLESHADFVDRQFGGRPHLTLFGSVGRERIRAGLDEMFREIYATAYGSAPWCDKTPNTAMIAALPRVRDVFPAVHVIFMKRRGVENVVSQLRKFPGQTVEAASSMWAEGMEGWLGVRDALGGCCLEVDQTILERDPYDAASTLVDFLGHPPARSFELGRFFDQRQQFERTRQAGAAQAYVGLEDLPWTDVQKSEFVKRAGHAMGAFGYRLTAEKLPKTRWLPMTDVPHELVLKNVHNPWTGSEMRGDVQVLHLHPNDRGEPPAEAAMTFDRAHDISGLRLHGSLNASSPHGLILRWLAGTAEGQVEIGRIHVEAGETVESIEVSVEDLRSMSVQALLPDEAKDNTACGFMLSHLLIRTAAGSGQMVSGPRAQEPERARTAARGGDGP